MAVILWSEYSCPNCRRKFDEADIIKAHRSRTCPDCRQPLTINAEEALTRSLSAAFLVVIVLGLAAIAWSAVFRVFGISDSFFQARSWAEPKLVGAVLPLFLLATIVVSSVGVALFVVKAYARMRLRE